MTSSKSILIFLVTLALFNGFWPINGQINDTLVFTEKATEANCECISVFECPMFKQLLEDRNFEELQTKGTCGFQNAIPYYCCPIETTTPFTTTTLEPISVSGRIQIEDPVIEDLGSVYAFKFLGN